MKVEFLPEPELEFGSDGTHIDARFGLMQYGPVDKGTPRAPSPLKIGIVGTNETVDGVRTWLERGSSPIPGKSGRLPNLFPPFPGFSEGSCFAASAVVHERWCVPIHRREIAGLLSGTTPDTLVSNAVGLFLDAARQVVEQGGPAVLICAPPEDLLAAMDESGARRPDPIDEELDEGSDPAPDRKRLRQPPFHDLLKARGMRIGVPIQMVRPDTYGVRRTKRGEGGAPRRLQDEATRAWNFHTALYYKGGGIPWRLLRDPSDLTTCFVGISFYRSLEGDRMLTSVAQVFNERGEGMIVKGGPAVLDREDRQPHLAAADAEALLRRAIDSFRREHRTAPARVVVHKTSKLNQEEKDGFEAAAHAERIDTLDLLAIRRSLTRLFREGTYPPLRGTFLELGRATGLVYLRGSVNFFEAYPGMYVPRPIEFSMEEANVTPRALAEELLALSKLNWNNTQFDGGEPMTVRAARRVGDILKCLAEGEEAQPNFRFFM
jgi:hypothetical protein